VELAAASITNVSNLLISLSVSFKVKTLPANDPFSRFYTALITAPVPSTAGLTALPAPVMGPASQPVGHLLSLPADTFLFGLHDNGSHLYIRPCYLLLLTAITTLFATWRGVLVKGVAGVGKVRTKTSVGLSCLQISVDIG